MAAPRRPLKVLSTVLIVAGTALVLVPLVWMVYTSWRIGPAQAAALAGWEEEAPEATAASISARESPPGSPIVLSIPRLRLTRFVPHGASVPQLRRFGVGRITWTALPDRPGVVGIAGHRTTYGAPFFRLASLRRGDHILITYRGKRFDYVVTDRRVVRPSEADVLQAFPGDRRVALITCTPLYSARSRLVIFGNLQAVTPLSPTP